MAVSVLLSIALLFTVSYAREFACTVDEALCTGNGAQSIIVGGRKMCCPPGTATFSLNNNVCKCVVPDVQEEPCLEGIAQCRQANSFSRDSQGKLRCCLPGQALNMVSQTKVNGVLMDICTCTPVGSTGFLGSVLGLSHQSGPIMASNVAQAPSNASDLQSEWNRMGREWNSWGQNFARDFNRWGHNLGQSMRSTGLDLARGLSGVLQQSLVQTVRPLQQAFSGTLSNIFASIPGFGPAQPAQTQTQYQRNP